MKVRCAATEVRFESVQVRFGRHLVVRNAEGNRQNQDHAGPGVALPDAAQDFCVGTVRSSDSIS